MEMAGGNGPAGSPDADETSAPAQETKPPAASGGTGQEDAVTLTITIDGIEAKLLLEKNAAASALAKRLREGAVTYTANDFSGFEKVGEPLEFSLPRADTYIEAQPGDAVLYQGNRIVLFYGGNGWSYTRIGRLEGLSLSELADFLRAGKGAVRVTLSLDGSGCTE